MMAKVKGSAAKPSRSSAAKRRPKTRTAAKPARRGAKAPTSVGQSIETRLNVVHVRMLGRFVDTLRKRVVRKPIKLRDVVHDEDVQLFIGANYEPSGRHLKTADDVTNWLMETFVQRFSLDNPDSLVDFG